MLVIRLSRRGKKHQPSYRVLVAEKRSKLNSSVEDLGSYDPKTKKLAVSKERVNYWLKVGAVASPSIHNLLVKEKVIEGKKVAIYIRSKKAEAAPAA